ncbi:uncharacterized protein LOC108941928 [Scleropages formosus]|uniref:uncharacterized protein LOC108941928 n=1 Tax=Scleropages formosus TaxID=113540 RepID=UPI0010FA77F7|nr:uncharacterized protein LOC108941928 [Scleropages formosus]XP_029108970.1 uncharacterized protein LOC108941928 [Scleropages formosus]
MAAVGWTGFMLFLLLNISMGKDPERFTVSCDVGQTVTLPCKYTLSDCSMVTWLLDSESNPSTAIELVVHGKVKETQRSGRVTVGSDCSLHIKNLKTKDTGLYFCRLYHNNNNFTDISTVSLSFGENTKTNCFTPVTPPSPVSPADDDGFPVVPVAASCVAVCVGVCVTIVIILIYKRRAENHLSSSQVKVLDTDSVTYIVVDHKKSTQTETNRKTDNIITEYATIRTTQ